MALPICQTFFVSCKKKMCHMYRFYMSIQNDTMPHDFWKGRIKINLIIFFKKWYVALKRFVGLKYNFPWIHLVFSWVLVYFYMSFEIPPEFHLGFDTQISFHVTSFVISSRILSMLFLFYFFRHSCKESSRNSSDKCAIPSELFFGNFRVNFCRNFV